MRRLRASSSAPARRTAISSSSAPTRAKVVNDALGALRLKVGQDLKLVDAGWRPLWVVDFPMFEWDADEKRWVAMHHPFTSPRNDDPAALRGRSGTPRSPRPTTWC